MDFPFTPSAALEAQEMPDPGNEHVSTKEQLEAQQEELRNARDDLLGSRYSLNTQRREFRELQEKADTQASIAYDLIRRFLDSQAIALPDNIEHAISEAATLRESQVNRGVDLEESEDKYNLEEWRYTEKEAKFIEDLPGNFSVSHQPQLPMPLLETRNVDPGSLTKFSVGPSDLKDATIPPVEPGQGLLSSLESHNFEEIRVYSLKDFNPNLTPNYQERSGLWQRSLTPLLPHHVMSTQAFDPIQLPLRPHSETGLSQLQVDWAATRKRIDAWLFDILSKSKLQQGLLKDLTPREELSDDAWWKLVEQNWNSNGPDTFRFHTGDTTISDTARSRAVSHVTMNKLIESFETDNLDPHTPFLVPLLAEGRTLDKLKSVEFPTAIEPGDLAELCTKHVAFPTHTSSAGSHSTGASSGTPSISTSPTEMMRSSSHMHDSIMSGIRNVSTAPREELAVQSVDVLEDHISAPGCQENDSQESRLVDEREGGSLDNSSNTTPKNESHLAVDDKEERFRSLEEPVAQLSLTFTRPYSPESERDHTTAGNNEVHLLHRSTSDRSRMRPPSPPQTRSCSPREQQQSQDLSIPKPGSDL